MVQNRFYDKLAIVPPLWYSLWTWNAKKCFWIIKNGPSPASYSFIFVLSNKRYNFYKFMWKNVHPVYGAGIWTHNLQDMSLLP